ncbi:uncharacterized protein LOC114530058 isoform X2 [Dendronephthya gigantea]|uniref:uncharacterized protein LOC114530058 isoform X2 n=1 Tax=Dendronephthya gigantea TaxID=151771 RepID=UPI00106AC2E4|nr:uncharacterized protein LOC114530058 isoform X2 [Dendronephthya gigantea]
MEGSQQFQSMLDNVLLKRGIVSLTGSKDAVGCHVISFQTQQQLLFTQIGHSSLTELLHIVVTYYESALVSFLVNMSHSTPLFIDKFIHVIHQLEGVMSERRIKRVYVIRPERKPIRKHFLKELGNINNENTRNNAQVIVVKSFEELYQYIKQRDLTLEYGGTLQHDHNAWLAVQKTLIQFYLLVNNLAKTSADVTNRIRDLTSGGFGTKASERSTENAQKKRVRKAEKKKNEILRQYNVTYALENGQKLQSYFENPKLEENFQTLSKSPVFQRDKAVFQQYYRKLLALRDGFEHAWKEAVGKLRSFAPEQELYNRLIECCTWIVEEGLPYLSPVPTQSKTLAEAVKQKNNFENEFYKPVKVMLRKSRHTLKEVRQYQRSLRTPNGSLDLMADNLTQLMENITKKSELRLKHYTSEKDFMHVFRKAESWYEKASDLCPMNPLPMITQENTHLSTSRIVDPKIANFLEKYPPLTREEFGKLLEYVEQIDDLELRNRVRLLGNRCQEMEKMLNAHQSQHGDFSDEEESLDLESSSGQKRPSSGRNSSLQRSTQKDNNKLPLHSTISTDFSTKRWHDDVMSSTTVSNDDIVNSRSGTEDFGTGMDNSRLADIQRRLRDQELLYEQLILEQEIRELAEEKSSPNKPEVSLSSSYERAGSPRATKRAVVDFDDKGKISRTSLRNEDVPFTSSLNRNAEIGSLGTVVNDYHTGKAFRNRRSESLQRKSRKGKHRSIASDLNVSRSAVIENIDPILNGNVSAIGGINQPRNIGADQTKLEFGLLPVDTELSDKENRGNLTTSTRRENQGEINLLSPIDLLDGCNSLKRLCNLEIPSPQNNTFTTFEKYYSPGESVSTSNSSLIPPDGNVNTSPVVSSESRNRSDDPEDCVNNSENSRDVEFHSHEVEVFEPDSGSHSGLLDYEFEEVENSSTKAADMCIAQDSENSSHGRLRDPENSSRDVECYSSDSRTSSREVENVSNDSSREELLKAASEAANHWTNIKNKHRARLTQIVDNISTRKEIEKAYFNAQIQLCRARQSIVTLNESGGHAELSSENVVNGNMASSFNISLKIPDSEDKTFDGNGAFRKYIRDFSDDKTNTNWQENAKDTLLGTKKEEGEIGVEGNTKTDAGHDTGEPFESKDTSEEFTASQNLQGDGVLQENCKEFDSELEASDEFDDNVDEEELMLLCSQSSSGMLNQEELKESLREEQARLEDKFRQQKEQLRLEREKLIEGDKNIHEQESKNLEIGEIENQELLQNIESIGSYPLGKFSKGTKIDFHRGNMPMELNLPQPNTDSYDSPEREELRSHCAIPSPVHEAPSPRYEIPSLNSEFPSPPHETLTERNEMSFPQRETFPTQHEIASSHHVIPSLHPEIPSLQDEMTAPNEELLPQHEPYTPQGLRSFSQHETKTAEITPFNQENTSPIKPIDHTDVRVDGGVSDISEIIVSNSDDNRRCKIEEELISILQERPPEVEHEKLEVAGPRVPPLGMGHYPPAILDHNDDDIDEMNQLIDDLMISDLNRDNQSDYDEVDVDRFQVKGAKNPVNNRNCEDGDVNEGGFSVDLDNIGVNFGDDEENKMFEMDNGGRCVDDDRVSEDDVDVYLDDVGSGLPGDKEVNEGDVEITVDSCDVNVDDGRENKLKFDLPQSGLNNLEIRMDNHPANNDNQELKIGNYLVDLDIEDDVETKWDNCKVSLDDLEENKNERISDVAQTGSHLERTGVPFGDRMSAEGKDSRDESLGIDVEFSIDLNKHSEAVLANDLIGLLHNQKDEFSSQESLEVEEEHDLENNFVVACNNEVNHKIIEIENSKEEGILEKKMSLDKHEMKHKPEETTSNVSEKHSSTDDENGIPEGHQFMSDDSEDDDDFCRVLEDIKEEESEYEDLMRYKATHVDSNDNKSSFSSSVIIDPGTGYCKAGFSVDDKPRVVIPSVVGMPKSEVQHSGRYKDYYVGEEAKHLHRVLNLHRPLKNGFVEDWDLMEKLLDEVYEELRCESDQYPVLISEPVSNPKTSREEMIQVMFETFHVPAAYSCAQAVLSLFATGRTTGLVFDCGYSRAHSVPVYEGYALSHATNTTELAGRELTACLSRMLRDRGVTMETHAELDIARDIKEKLCYMVMDYESERKAYNVGERNDTFYTMPDGQTVAIGSERFRCPEVLFAPSMIGMATDGVQEVIYKTTMQCAVDVRSSLLQNIVISGGSTMFSGFSRRLHVELCKLLGTRTPDSIKIEAVENRNFLTWQGGAMLSKLSNFKSMWITSLEYEEFGPDIVHKKCV